MSYKAFGPSISRMYGNWYRNPAILDGVSKLWDYVTGKTQYENTIASNQAQIDYNEYLRRGNERALADWHKNVPNRQIKYPELSYAGAIYRANTGTARSMYDIDSASANYYGNLGFRLAGLYGIASRVSRWM